MKKEVAIETIQKAEAFFQGKEHAISSSEVLNLAFESGCTAYDCEFVALAKSLRIFLITTDKQIVQAFPKIAMSPQAYLKQIKS